MENETNSFFLFYSLGVCDTGSYRPVNNRVTCIKCEIGKYQPDSGKTSCIPCGKATDVTTLQTGSSSKESCMRKEFYYLYVIKSVCFISFFISEICLLQPCI